MQRRYACSICNLSPQLFDNGEFLVNQMGSAAKMIDLLKTNEKIQQESSEILLAYVDMNNLKIINDR